ncbi:MAG: hypothetical protein R2867_09760 [Caldilineaceae bacterium]
MTFTCVSQKDISKLPKVPDTSVLDNNNDFFVCISEKIVLEKLINRDYPLPLGTGQKLQFLLQGCIRHFGQMEIGKIINIGQLSTDTAKWGPAPTIPKFTAWN